MAAPGIKTRDGQELKMRSLIKFWQDEAGATAVEYSLLAALIAAVIVIVVTVLGTKTQATYNKVNQVW